MLYKNKTPYGAKVIDIIEILPEKEGQKSEWDRVFYNSFDKQGGFMYAETLMLDVTFKEDDCRARAENSAENLNILRKLALQLMKQETSSSRSMRAKRLRCAFDFNYALKVIGLA